MKKLEDYPLPMNALIVDPMTTVNDALAPALSARKWHVDHARHVHEINELIMNHPPDLIVVHGDGAGGEAAHICQRFKQNVLTAGIPIILVEDAPPPAWMLAREAVPPGNSRTSKAPNSSTPRFGVKPKSTPARPSAPIFV